MKHIYHTTTISINVLKRLCMTMVLGSLYFAINTGVWGQTCENPSTLILSSAGGSTCGTIPITVGNNTFGGGAISVTITTNGNGIANPETTDSSPFSFTYTPAAEDIGSVITITVTAINPDVDCEVVAVDYLLTVNPIPSTPTASNNGPLCAGTTLNLTTPDVTDGTFSWTGPNDFTSALQNPSITDVTTADAGTYYVTVTVNGCTSLAGSTTVVINPLPSQITGNNYTTAGSSTTLTNASPGGTWNSSVPSVAEINPATGVVTGISGGVTVITYRLPTNCSVSMTLNVLPSDWEFDPLDFTYNSLVTAGVFLEGTKAESGFLAAFVGNECRGIVESYYNSQYDNYIFELNCYSDLDTGDVMVFRYFNPDEDVEYNMDRSVNFDSEIDVGSASAPFIMNIGTGYSLSLPIGWNWFSVNSTLDNMSLEFIMSSINTQGDYIKNQTVAASYYEGYGWFGSLQKLDPRELYKIKVQNSSGIDFIGRPVDVNTISIPVDPGWNWIGYLPQESLSVPSALESLTLANLDYIKGQSSSATYYSSYDLWFGSLDNLIPTEGYMLKVANSGDLKYPVSEGKGSQIFSGMEQSLFNPNQFEYSGSLTAKVMMDGSPKGSVKDSLYAYVNNELRGVTPGLLFPVNETWVFDLMVHSNVIQGEVVNFKYYNSDTRKLYNCAETVTFTSDMVLFSAINPLLLHADPTATSVNEEDILREPILSVYPNPSEDYVNIGYILNEPADVRITVYDIHGRAIRTLVDQKQEPDNYLFRWDSDLPPGGVYYIKLETGQRQKIRKVILLK